MAPHGEGPCGLSLPTRAVPNEGKKRSVSTLRDRLVKIGAKVVRHGRSITFQMAEAMVSRGRFGEVPPWVAQPRKQPAPT